MENTKPVPSISIVIPTYHSKNFIEETIEEISIWISKSSREVEVVLVDDGSTDGTFEKILEISKSKKINVQAIQLFKNVGQFQAIMAGLSIVQNEIVITMDDDLEYSPQQIDNLLEPFFDNPDKYDVVIGVATRRKRSLFRNFASSIVNRINTVMFRKPHHLRSGSFRAMTLELAKKLLEFKTANPVIGPLIFKATRRVTNVEVEHQEGLRKSNYSFFSLVATFYNNVINFSEFPLRYISQAGLWLAILSMLSSLFFLIQYLTDFPTPIRAPGWTSLIIAITFFSGVILFSVGFLGQYVYRIIEEVNKTPNYQIRKTVNVLASAE